MHWNYPDNLVYLGLLHKLCGSMVIIKDLIKSNVKDRVQQRRVEHSKLNVHD
jgi:hypothetical protein